MLPQIFQAGQLPSHSRLQSPQRALDARDLGLRRNRVAALPLPKA